MANLRIESEDHYGIEFIIFFKLGGVLFDWNMGEFSIVKNKCDIADFKLNTPIFVRVEPDYNDYAIYDSFTGIYSFVSTISEAKENFCATLEDTYKFLLEDIENLSPINKKTLYYLAEILTRKWFGALHKKRNNQIYWKLSL